MFFFLLWKYRVCHIDGMHFTLQSQMQEHTFLKCSLLERLRMEVNISYVSFFVSVNNGHVDSPWNFLCCGSLFLQWTLHCYSTKAIPITLSETWCTISENNCACYSELLRDRLFQQETFAWATSNISQCSEHWTRGECN